MKKLTGFNPLQVSQKPSKDTPSRACSSGFNPLQVSQKPNSALRLRMNLTGFNPLQVSQKQSRVYRGRETKGMFQSLVGKLETLGNPKPADNSKECFNPLQVSQKLFMRTVQYSAVVSFNPLQVSQKPLFSNWTNLGCKGFNPLQVSQKRYKHYTQCQCGRQFQSLVGKLETKTSQTKAQPEICVSIPCR